MKHTSYYPGAGGSAHLLGKFLGSCFVLVSSKTNCLTNIS